MIASAQAAAEALRCPPLDPDRDAVFLDLDGTLLPIASKPEDVPPDPELNAMLRMLAERLAGRLAVISGRAVADVDRLLDRAVGYVAGVHGLERRDSSGAHFRTPPAAGLAPALKHLRAFAETRPGTIIENKGTAVTLHYRLAAEFGPEAQILAGELSRRHGLDLQLGDMVAELKTPGADKGSAVRAAMQAPPFEGARPIFVGDDLTDEHGYAAASALGGFGVLVGRERSTAAACRLADVMAVRSWLRSALT